MTQKFKQEWVGKELMLVMERHGKPQKIVIEREDKHGNVVCRVAPGTITRLSPVYVETLLTGKKPKPDAVLKPATKPEVVHHTPAPKPVAKPAPQHEPSKRERAEAIYKRMHAKHTRKEIIQAFIDELDMTTAGASTYYQNIKNS